MTGYAKIKYKGIIVGKRAVEGSFQALEDMIGIKSTSSSALTSASNSASTSMSTTSSSTTTQLDRAKAVAMLKQYLIKQVGVNDTMDLIDLTLTVTTADGHQNSQVLKHGFKDVPAAAMVSMQPPAAAAPAEATTVVKEKHQSKYQAKRQQVAGAFVGEVTSTLKQSPKYAVWRDKHDDEDAIPDSELNPRALARRKQLEERAEAQAFAGYRANRGIK